MDMYERETITNLCFPADMMIMDLLSVGTPQGITTVEGTASVKGSGHQAMAMIIMGAGMSIIQGLEFGGSWSSVVIKIGLGPS